jgi:Domain of unknown function (DUF5753)
MSGTIRTAKKLLLGREIAHMIANTTVFTTDGNEKLSHTKAAALIETSQTRMTGLLNGTGSIKPAELELLAIRLGFTDQAHIDTLLELRRNSHQRGAWATGYNRAYAEDFRLRVDLERHADLIRTVEVEIMPGLAQCEAYIRALHQGFDDQHGVTEEDFIQARLQRQQVLLRDDSPEYRVVMSESCLWREYATPEIMREQLDHLITLSRRPNVVLQVLPFRFRAGVCTPMNHPFVLLRVPSPGAAGPLEVAYLEGLGDIRYLDKDTALTAHDNTFHRLSTHALNANDTRKFIRHTTKTRTNT